MSETTDPTLTVLIGRSPLLVHDAPGLVRSGTAAVPDATTLDRDRGSPESTRRATSAVGTTVVRDVTSIARP
jgi:hypothetical protein